MKVDLLNSIVDPSGSRDEWLGAFNELARWHVDW